MYLIRGNRIDYKDLNPENNTGFYTIKFLLLERNIFMFSKTFSRVSKQQ